MISILFILINLTLKCESYTECGITYFESNVRIVGGVPAVPYSWPAQVLIVFTFKGDFNLSTNSIKTITQQSICGGTIISEQVVMTAAHCIPTSFDYIHQGQVYRLPIRPNAYYPSWASMYTIYAGVHNIKFLQVNQVPAAPGVKRAISNVIVVSKHFH